MESFRADGEWWPVDRPEQRVPGTLEFSEADGARLRLSGSFLDFSQIGTVSDAGSGATKKITSDDIERTGTYPRIVGIAEGKVYTLEDCFRTQLTNFLLGRDGKESIYVRYVFKGVEFTDDEAIVFDRIECHLADLIYWLNAERIEESHTWPHPMEMTIKVAARSALRFSVSRQLRGYFQHQIGNRGDRIAERTLYQDYSVQFTVGENCLSLAELLGQVALIQHLVAIAIGRATPIVDVRLHHPELSHMVGRGRVFNDIDFYGQLLDSDTPDSGERPSPHQMLFTYQDLAPVDGVTHWMIAATRHQSALNRLMRTRLSGSGFVSDRLLNSTAALEAFDRKLNGDTVVHGKRRTFGDRVRFCLQLAGPDFAGLFDDEAVWLKELTKQRDDVAHRLERDPLGGGLPTLVLADSAYFLFVCCLLTDAGLTTVRDQMVQHDRLRFFQRQLRSVMTSLRC